MALDDVRPKTPVEQLADLVAENLILRKALEHAVGSAYFAQRVLEYVQDNK